MSHPFTKLFDLALRSNLPGENKLLDQAEELRRAGYPVQEIHDVLLTFVRGLISDSDRALAKEALDEMATYLE